MLLITTSRSPDVSWYMGEKDESGKYNEGSIIWRMDNFAANPKRNNMLAVTTDARKAGLDYRLINPNAEVEDEYSKSSDMVKNIVNEYHLWDKDKGTQLVFCNLSTPTCKSQNVDVNKHTQIKDESLSAILNADTGNENAESISQDEIIAKEQKFDVYSDVLKKLVKAGIPQKEIAFIHDANTDIQKRDLFDKVNRGEIRVLIGSTFKMGAGTNVQERIVALHSLDCPWRPSDLAQGDGRAIRQGNVLHKKYGHENFSIGIYRYATEQTYDARMWQSIEFKARGIEGFRNGCKDPSQRTLEDVSMGSASAAEMKAAATGNPLFLTQQQIKAELRKEENRERAFKRDLFALQERLKREIAYTPLLENELTTLKDIKNTLDSNPKGESFVCECFDGERFHSIKIDDGKSLKEKELDSAIKATTKELEIGISFQKTGTESKQIEELKAKLDSLKLERAELLYPTMDKLKEAANKLEPRSNGEAKRFIEDFIKPLELKMDKNELDSLSHSITQKAQENARKALTLSGQAQLAEASENKKTAQEKAFEDMFWKNFDNALNSGGDEVPLFKYRGMQMNGMFNDRLDEFSLKITDSSGKNYIEPKNLVYTMNRGNMFDNNWRNKISFNGLWRRINNVCNDIDKHIATQQKALITNSEVIKETQEQLKNGEYPNKAYLEALRNDDRQILIEINKSATNKDYKSTFEAKSPQIKAAQEKARREAALQAFNKTNKVERQC